MTHPTAHLNLIASAALAPEGDAALLAAGAEFARLLPRWQLAHAAHMTDATDDAAAERNEALLEAISGLVERAEALPATTIAGLAIKARFALWRHGLLPYTRDGADDPVAHSLVGLVAELDALAPAWGKTDGAAEK